MAIGVYPYDPDRLNPSHNGTILSHAALPADGLPFGSAYGVLRKGMAQEPMTDARSKLYVPIRGEAELESEGQRYPLRSGRAVLIPAGTPHAVRHVGEEEFVNLCLWWGEKR